MTERHVTLDFHCCDCEEPVGVTVLCRDKGSEWPPDGVVALNVACPACGEVNQVFFEPDGTLRRVRPLRRRLTVPAPSVN
jgi:hypothetical protein